MWIVCEFGFYNIVQSDGDAKKGLLTIKARRRQDLLSLQVLTGEAAIEQSNDADYKYRMKVPMKMAASAICDLVGDIKYSKTKDRLAKTHPDRMDTYFEVWDSLSYLQDNRT